MASSGELGLDVVKRVGRGDRSALSLDGLQVDEDSPQHLVAQDALPDGHALGETPRAHRLVEHRGRPISVAEREPAQVERPLSLDRVRPVAMPTVLVEQAATHRGRVGGIVRQARGGRRRLLGRGGGPGESTGGGERYGAQRAVNPRQLLSSNTTMTPPSGLASMTFWPILPRNDGGPFTRPATTARYCLPSTAYVIGLCNMPVPTLNFHRTSPVFASTPLRTPWVLP